MNIHLISTGRVKVTQNWRVGKGEGAMRLVNAISDRNFTDWLPIYCAVIEHPEGLMVIDTGIPTDANKPVYLPPHIRLLQRAAPFEMSADQELGAQMRQRGLDPADVRRVILTHLHQDHDGGLKDFPKAEVVLARQEWAAGQGWGGRVNGYFNWRWRNTTPRLIDFKSGAYHNFASSEVLAKDIHLVPTPGHSKGHLSVIVEQGDLAVMIAGDSAYNADLLLRDVADGVGPDPAAQHDSHRHILDFAARIPTIFLPCHDPDAEDRLTHNITVPIERVFA